MTLHQNSPLIKQYLSALELNNLSYSIPYSRNNTSKGKGGAAGAGAWITGAGCTWRTVKCVGGDGALV